MQEVKHYKVKTLPSLPNPNSIYYVKATTEGTVHTYITDQFGQAFPLIDLTGGGGTGSGNIASVTGTGVTGTTINPIININTFLSSQLGNLLILSSTDQKLFVKPITSPDGSININSTATALELQIPGPIKALINSALQPGANISLLTNDAGYITSAGVPASLFTHDIPVVLSNGKTLGKYTSGQTIPAIGKTFEEVITDIALEYVQSAFTSFTVSPYTSYSNTVEVGTNLSGTRTFSWAITQNSGTVNTFSIYDNTTSTNIGTGLTGTSANLLTNTRLLSTEADTQSWKAIGNNTAIGHIGTIDSTSVVVTARYSRWWGATDSNPTDRTSALLLPSTGFQTPGVNTFTLVTGTTKLKMVVLLPPSKTITSVYDSTNNATITSSYILSTISINDANGTARTYNMYVLSLGSAYPLSANHVITTSA